MNLKLFHLLFEALDATDLVLYLCGPVQLLVVEFRCQGVDLFTVSLLQVLKLLALIAYLRFERFYFLLILAKLFLLLLEQLVVIRLLVLELGI